MRKLLYREDKNPHLENGSLFYTEMDRILSQLGEFLLLEDKEVDDRL